MRDEAGGWVDWEASGMFLDMTWTDHPLDIESTIALILLFRSIAFPYEKRLHCIGGGAHLMRRGYSLLLVSYEPLLLTNFISK
jgi:hypothetical protein